MSRLFVAPRQMLEKKAPHGQPCTRCGLCCHASLCSIGYATFKNRTEPAAFGLGPCPALKFDNGLSSCGLVDHPEQHAPGLTEKHGIETMRAAAKAIIAPATGCDARFNGEPTNHQFNARMAEWDKQHADEVRQAKILWGVE